MYTRDVMYEFPSGGISGLNPRRALKLTEDSLAAAVVSPAEMIKMIITHVDFVASLRPVVSL